MGNIRTWEISARQGSIQFQLPDTSSLDAITRQLPEGFYSTFRTYGECRRVLGLKAHLRRLYEPVSAPEVNASELRRQLLSLLEPYRPGEARVRVMMTRQGKAYLAIEPLNSLPRDVYEKGVRVITTDIQRDQPRLKSTAFITESEAKRKHIAETGTFEALLVRNGRILEGMTSNFFYVRGGALGTARRDVLLGVTRQTVIRLARGRGMDVVFRPLALNQLPAVEEAFITSSSRGIVPVIQIDDDRVGEGRPGQITQHLSAAYAAYVTEKAERI